MPTLQAMAPIALAPIGVPISSPRTVWVTGVKGWSQQGIHVSVA